MIDNAEVKRAAHKSCSSEADPLDFSTSLHNTGARSRSILALFSPLMLEDLSPLDGLEGSVAAPSRFSLSVAGVWSP